MNKHRAILAVASLAAAAIGFFIARSGARDQSAPMTVDSIGGVTASETQSGITPRKHRTESATGVRARNARRLEALKKDLMTSFANSPSHAHDWALCARTARLLASLGTEDLEKLASGLRPEKGSLVSSEDWLSSLMDQIYRAWGLRDPARCMENAGGWSFGENAFNDWLARDPEAAAAWLSQADFPPEKESARARMRLSQINRQALTDFATARQVLEHLDAKTQQSALQGWASMFANDVSKRTELLDFLASWPDSKTAESCYKKLIGGMAARSPHDAAMFIETMNIAEDVKERLSHDMISKWAVNEPANAFNAWLGTGGTEVPKPFFSALDNWSINSPGAEEAIQWVNGIKPGPAKEQFKTHMIGHFSRFERFGQAAQLSSNLADPAARVRQMKLVKRIWEERFPKQANEWFSKLPPEDRAAVEKPLE